MRLTTCSLLGLLLLSGCDKPSSENPLFNDFKMPENIFLTRKKMCRANFF